MFYVDEVDIHLNPKIGLDWMLAGQQKRVLTPGQNQKRYLAGALNVKTRRLTWVKGTSKNSMLFVKLIDQLLLTHRGVQTLHIVLDNVKIHSSRAVEPACLRW
jgi:transposase